MARIPLVFASLLILFGCGGADPPEVDQSSVDVTPAAEGDDIFKAPLDAAPSEDGLTFFFAATDTATSASTVFSVPAAGGSVSTVWSGAPLVNARGILAVGATLFAADPGAGSILSMPASGGSMPAFVAGTELMKPTALSSSPEGLIFTGVDPSSGDAAVLRIPIGGGPVAVVYSGSPLMAPDGVAAGGDGTIYVADARDGAKANGAVFAITGGSVKTLAEKVALGSPAGIALPRDEATLWVSSLDPEAGTSQVLIIDLKSGGTSVFNGVIGANTASGGLHRAAKADIFSWCGVTAGTQGTVFRVEP
jgi:hypothetical protein